MAISSVPAAVGSETFVQNQMQLAAYRQGKLAENAAKKKEKEDMDAEKAEEAGYGEIQGITDQIVKGFHPQVQKEYNSVIAKIHDIYDTPGRTNADKYGEMEKAVHDFSDNLKPMIESSKVLLSAHSAPQDKLNVEQLAALPSIDKFINGNTDWDGFVKELTHNPNSLASLHVVPEAYGFNMIQQEIANPENLLTKGAKGNIVDAIEAKVQWHIDPKTGLEVGTITPKDAAGIAHSLMLNDSQFAPGAGMFNGMLGAGYGSADKDGNMLYQKAIKDAQGNTTAITTKDVPELKSVMEDQLTKMILDRGTYVRNPSGYSDYTLGQKEHLAYINAGAHSQEKIKPLPAEYQEIEKEIAQTQATIAQKIKNYVPHVEEDAKLKELQQKAGEITKTVDVFRSAKSKGDLSTIPDWVREKFRTLTPAEAQRFVDDRDNGIDDSGLSVEEFRAKIAKDTGKSNEPEREFYTGHN